MRPIYENEWTMAGESVFSEFAKQKLNCELSKCPRSYMLDFAAVRGQKVVAFIEFKRRTNNHDLYPTYMIAARKRMQAKAIRDSSKLPVYLYVQWNDVLGYTNLATCEANWQMGGRKDRNDPADQEPVIHIQLSEFKIFKND